MKISIELDEKQLKAIQFLYPSIQRFTKKQRGGPYGDCIEELEVFVLSLQESTNPDNLQNLLELLKSLLEPFKSIKLTQRSTLIKLKKRN